MTALFLILGGEKKKHLNKGGDNNRIVKAKVKGKSIKGEKIMQRHNKLYVNIIAVVLVICTLCGTAAAAADLSPCRQQLTAGRGRN